MRRALAAPAAAALIATGVLVAGFSATGARAAEEPVVPPSLDYAFYVERVSPIVHRVCAECHADPRKRLGKHFLRPAQERTPRESDHRKNFETLGKLITPGNPAKSIWLLKPLGARQGGVPHKGGEKIRFDSLEYATMIEFINGARVAPPASARDASEARPAVPEVSREGLTVEVEAFERKGDVSAVPVEGAQGLVVVARVGTVHLTHAVRVPEDRSYEIVFRAFHPATAKEPASFTFRVDRGAPQRVEVPPGGFSTVGPRTPCDGAAPLAEAAGDLRVDGEALRMQGAASDPARWLAGWQGEHAGVEVVVDLPSEEDGGDDALVLFDAVDGANAKYVGLTDGGRRLVLGVMEGGRLRALSSAEAPPTPALGERRIRVEYVDGVAVGRLDGKPLVHANLDARLGTVGRFGVLAHGRLVVKSAAAFGQYELHRVRFQERPLVALGQGPHVVTVELGPSGPALDAMVLRETAP